MAVNRYFSRQIQPYVPTLRPLPFQEILNAGLLKQKAMDDTNLAADKLEAEAIVLGGRSTQDLVKGLNKDFSDQIDAIRDAHMGGTMSSGMAASKLRQINSNFKSSPYVKFAQNDQALIPAAVKTEAEERFASGRYEAANRDRAANKWDQVTREQIDGGMTIDASRYGAIFDPGFRNDHKEELAAVKADMVSHMVASGDIPPGANVFPGTDGDYYYYNKDRVKVRALSKEKMRTLMYRFAENADLEGTDKESIRYLQEQYKRKYGRDFTSTDYYEKLMREMMLSEFNEKDTQESSKPSRLPGLGQSKRGKDEDSFFGDGVYDVHITADTHESALERFGISDLTSLRNKVGGNNDDESLTKFREFQDDRLAQTPYMMSPDGKKLVYQANPDVEVKAADEAGVNTVLQEITKDWDYLNKVLTEAEDEFESRIATNYKNADGTSMDVQQYFEYVKEENSEAIKKGVNRLLYIGNPGGGGIPGPDVAAFKNLPEYKSATKGMERQMTAREASKLGLTQSDYVFNGTVGKNTADSMVTLQNSGLKKAYPLQYKNMYDLAEDQAAKAVLSKDEKSLYGKINSTMEKHLDQRSSFKLGVTLDEENEVHASYMRAVEKNILANHLIVRGGGTLEGIDGDATFRDVKSYLQKNGFTNVEGEEFTIEDMVLTHTFMADDGAGKMQWYARAGFPAREQEGTIDKATIFDFKVTELMDDITELQEEKMFHVAGAVRDKIYLMNPGDDAERLIIPGVTGPDSDVSIEKTGEGIQLHGDVFININGNMQKMDIMDAYTEFQKAQGLEENALFGSEGEAASFLIDAIQSNDNLAKEQPYKFDAGGNYVAAELPADIKERSVQLRGALTDWQYGKIFPNMNFNNNKEVEDMLTKIVGFETAGTYDPGKYNPSEKAVGLIQFYKDANTERDKDGQYYKTIKGKKYTLASLARMSIEEQVNGPMKEYFQEQGGKVKSPMDIYLSVFSPEFLSISGDTPVYDFLATKDGPGKAQQTLLKVAGDNPAFFTGRDIKSITRNEFAEVMLAYADKRLNSLM